VVSAGNPTTLSSSRSNPPRFSAHSAVLRLTAEFAEKRGDKSRTLTWHGVHLGEPDWSYQSHSLAFSLSNLAGAERLHFILNSYWEPLEFDLPVLLGQRWHRAVDTSRPTPDDYCEPGSEPAILANTYQAESRSAVVLIGR
jgi:glycogen operon protein